MSCARLATHSETGGSERCAQKQQLSFVICICRFFQNQIKSEEQFQENKAKLREQARATLEHLFDKKGKHLVIDSDDDFSICSSELSAWDSDVDSISSMVSCAADWVQETQFQAPALQQLRAIMLLTLVSRPLLLHMAWQLLMFALAGWSPQGPATYMCRECSSLMNSQQAVANYNYQPR
jgi:hypothetical protein